MNIKQLLGNKQVLSLAGNVVMAVLNLATVGILNRNLSKADMGCWAFFLIVFTLIDTFRSGFLQTAFVKFYAGTDEIRAKNVLGSTWYMGILITCGVIVLNLLSLLALPFIADLAYITVIKYTSILFITTLPIVMATWALQARQGYREILYIRIVNQSSLIIEIIVLIWLKKLTLNNAVIANILSCVLTCIMVFALRWTGVRTLASKTKSGMLELYHFGKFSVGTSISANLLRSSDIFIIKIMFGAAANGMLGIYNAAQTLNNLIDIPLRSFVTTATTSIAAAQNKNDKAEVEYIFKKYAGGLSIIFLPVIAGLFIFADFGVGLLGGGQYVHSPAANLFRIFLCVALFLPIDRFIGVTLDVIHKPKINMYKVLIMLTVNVVGDFTAAYLMHNLYGIAIASIPTFVVGVLFGYFSLKRYLKFNIVEITKLGWAESIVLVKMVLGKFAGKIFKQA